MLVLNTVVILISDTFKLARKALDIKNKHTTKCLQNLHLFRCLIHVFSDKFKLSRIDTSEPSSKLWKTLLMSNKPKRIYVGDKGS